jgi:Uma2 family endonuclease
MPLVQTVDEIEYPESDGMPMGETDIHRDWMFRILEILRLRYRGQRVYLASNLLLYYQEGYPTKFVVPDDFVVLDCDPGPRRTFRVWEEGKAPDVVFEVTSRGTKQEDEVYKPQIYARIGVKEYFLYDPTAEYLQPPLQGFRLERDEYRRIQEDDSGTLKCSLLDITLRLDHGKLLVMCDGRSGQVLRTEAEAAEQARQAAEQGQQAAEERRQAAEQARQAAEAGRQAAETRAAQLEVELERLKEELERKTRKQ